MLTLHFSALETLFKNMSVLETLRKNTSAQKLLHLKNISCVYVNLLRKVDHELKELSVYNGWQEALSMFYLGLVVMFASWMGAYC